MRCCLPAGPPLITINLPMWNAQVLTRVLNHWAHHTQLPAAQGPFKESINRLLFLTVTLASICSTMPHINATPAPPAWSPSMVVLTTKVAPTREGELMWSYPLYIKPCMDRQPLYTDGRCLQLRR